MRSSTSLLTLSFFVLTSPACGGPGFSADALPVGPVPEAGGSDPVGGTRDSGMAGATMSEDGGISGSVAGGMPAQGGSGSGSGSGGLSGSGGSISGAAGSSGGPVSGSGGVGSSGGSVSGSGGAGVSGASGGGSVSGSGGAGAGAGGASMSPYPGCSRDYMSSQCGGTADGIAFRFQCGQGVDPSSCVYDENHVATCACNAVPGVPGAFCCQQNSLSCSVAPSVGMFGKCGGVNGGSSFCDASKFDPRCRPYFYSNCGSNPDPDQDSPDPNKHQCTILGFGNFCCSGPYLK
jgi:hypothetical protein